jgi:Swt1-like HEPN
MAVTNHERVGKALDLLKEGLRPLVERELKAQLGERWTSEVKNILSDTRLGGGKGSLKDVAVMLVIMDRTWGSVFRRILGRAERALINELSDVRNRWAHQEPFSSDDTYRALDSTTRLLTAVSASQADEVGKMLMELQRVRFDEQMRGEKRKSASGAIETQATGALKPWREVVSPHPDVASGRYQQAEFAADLWQVHIGEGSDEYRKPVEFFGRTHLTESLKRLLIGAVQRLKGKGGDPVVQLQTNFGGGKTHSMLALYHLFSGTAPGELVGVDAVLADAGTSKLPKVNRVVLVGNKISPGNPVVKADGTVVRTLWGELAWQLGHAAGGAKEAKKAFQRLDYRFRESCHKRGIHLSFQAPICAGALRTKD